MGEVSLREIMISGYDKSLEGSDGWIVIKGENFDKLTNEQLINITTSLGVVINAKIKDSFTIEVKFTQFFGQGQYSPEHKLLKLENLPTSPVGLTKNTVYRTGGSLCVV